MKQDQLQISVADVSFRLLTAGCPDETTERLLEHYGPFLVESSGDAPSLRLRFEPGDPFISIPNCGPIQIRTAREGGCINFVSHFEEGWYDEQSRQGELVMRPEGDPENYLRVLYAWKMLEQDGLLLHAAGVIRRERGFVFFGASGSGKTTISRFSLQDKVLSDDMVILKLKGDQVRVYGVPFRGEIAEAPRMNGTAPLKGLFSLVKDNAHFLRPVDKLRAVAQLTGSVPFVLTAPGSAAQVMSVCERIVGRVPVTELHFSRDDAFWEVIDGS